MRVVRVCVYATGTGVCANTLGAPSGNGVLVQSGKTNPPWRTRSTTWSGAASSSSSSPTSSFSTSASSHRSRVISSPPVFSALHRAHGQLDRIKEGAAYPASDPPSHGKIAGVNAGALPALTAFDGGCGLLRIEMNGARGLSGA